MIIGKYIKLFKRASIFMAEEQRKRIEKLRPLIENNSFVKKELYLTANVDA